MMIKNIQLQLDIISYSEMYWTCVRQVVYTGMLSSFDSRKFVDILFIKKNFSGFENKNKSFEEQLFINVEHIWGNLI